MSCTLVIKCEVCGREEGFASNISNWPENNYDHRHFHRVIVDGFCHYACMQRWTTDASGEGLTIPDCLKRLLAELADAVEGER
jgi:hypothetical protein